MNDMINAGMFEHITKMGRIGGRFDSIHKPKAGPHFKEMLSADLSPTPPPPRPQVQPPSLVPIETTVIYRDPFEREPVHSSPRQSPVQKELSFIGSDRLEEMKLGRNQRAVQKGGVVGWSNQLDTDVSEPLLTLGPNPPGNIVLDYFTNTHPACPRPTVPDGAHTPARTLTSPQHPSQDLIEMLNRNQLNHSPIEPRNDEPQRQLREEPVAQVLVQPDRDVASLPLASSHRDVDKLHVIETQHEDNTEAQPKLDTETEPRESPMQNEYPFAHGRVYNPETGAPLNTGIAGPDMPVFRSMPELPPVSLLYSRETKDFMIQEPSEKASTKGMSPRVTGSFTYTPSLSPSNTLVTPTSTFEVKDKRSDAGTMEMQETRDDIQEIEDQLVSNEKAASSDEFAF